MLGLLRICFHVYLLTVSSLSTMLLSINALIFAFSFRMPGILFSFSLLIPLTPLHNLKKEEK
jgi:hypothetical protein